MTLLFKTALCRTARLAAARAFGAVLLILPAGAVMAAPAILDDVYFDDASKTCTNKAVCEVNFSAIPNGRLVVIQRVACSAAVPSSAAITAVELRHKNGGDKVAWQTLNVPRALSEVNGTRNLAIAAETLLALQTGRRPALAMQLRTAAASVTLSCTIHGTTRNDL